MRQQINLYQPLFRKQEKLFSANTMAIFVVVAIVLMGLIHIYNVWQISLLKENSATLSQHRDSQFQQLQKLIKQFPKKEKDKQLPLKVEAAKQQLFRHQQLLASIQLYEFGDVGGFSEHLKGLARQRQPKMWLTQITLTQGGNHLLLSGTTLEREQLPQFIQKLSREDKFRGIKISHLSMTRSEEQANQLDFTVSSKPLKEEKP